jgi:hypothetical protein
LASVLPNLLLVGHGSLRQPVVFERREPLVVHELQLIDQIVPAVVPEHPKMRGVFQLELPSPARPAELNLLRHLAPR